MLSQNPMIITDYIKILLLSNQMQEGNMSIYETISFRADALMPELIEIRRDLHKHAEAGWLEIRTSSIIADRLSKLGYTVLTGEEVCMSGARMGLPDQAALDDAYTRAIAQGAVQPWADRAKDGHTGVIGILHCGDGPVIGMRFDIDALGVFEDAGDSHVPAREGFRSVNEGTMHACGHDGHTAIGLGTAELLAGLKDRLHGTIKLIFQPAEEGVRGAKSIVESGILDDVDLMLGNHIFGCRDEGAHVYFTTGSTLATTKLDISFTGRACHAGTPENGSNALLAAATAVLNLHAIPRHGAGSTRVNVGTLHAGSGRNVICDRAKMEVEVRGANTAINEYMEHYCRNIVNSAAQMHECLVDIKLMGATGSLTNDVEVIERCAEVCTEKLGLTVPPTTPYAGGSEDYAYMADRVRAHGGQSLFFYTVSKMAGVGHAKDFDFDESCLSTGVKVFCAMACDRMGIE